MAGFGDPEGTFPAGVYVLRGVAWKNGPLRDGGGLEARSPTTPAPAAFEDGFSKAKILAAVKATGFIARKCPEFVAVREPKTIRGRSNFGAIKSSACGRAVRDPRGSFQRRCGPS